MEHALGVGRLAVVRAAASLGLVVVLLCAVVGCSRGTGSDSAAKSDAASAEHDSMGLKLNGLNYTEVPIGDFYVDGTWGAAIPSRIGSWGASSFVAAHCLTNGILG